MLPLDALARKTLIVCGVLFLLATALNINGSSIFLWKEWMHDQNSDGSLLLSTPKAVRSDEWAVWTPAVLWQAEHAFPLENPALGAGKVPLIYNLPVRYYTTFFRPQFYGFFLFDIEHGYAWYWNFKVFGLLVSIFFLLRLLTINTTVSLFATGWLYLSSYTQWWFSCPPMLPEMLSSWAVAVSCILIVLTCESSTARVGATLIFCVSALNFVLCLYPPFQIPLFYLGALIVLGFSYQHRRQGGKFYWRRGMICIGLAVAGCVATLWPFFSECRSTLEILAHTSYPGHRRTYGGAVSLRQLLSGLLNFFDSETNYPEEWGSVANVANFYPLWIPILALTWPGFVLKPRKHALQFSLLAFLLAACIYAVCGFPRWICDATLLSFCTENRMLLAIGVANVLFCAVNFTLLKERFASLKRPYSLATIVLLGLLVWCYLQACAPASPRFFTQTRFITLASLNLTLIVLLVTYPHRLFRLTFLSLFAVTNLLVNPVMVGLGPLLTATPRAAVKQLRGKYPQAGWVVYDSNTLSDFIMSTGANVLSGVKVVPNLEFYRRIDPERKNLSIYNRYSFACFSLPPRRGVVSIRDLAFPAHLVEIEPFHPAFRQEHVRFFVFPEELAGAASAGLTLITSFPDNHVWIYVLTAEQA